MKPENGQGGAIPEASSLTVPGLILDIGQSTYSGSLPNPDFPPAGCLSRASVPGEPSGSCVVGGDAGLGAMLCYFK